VDSTELWSNRDTRSNYHSILVLDDELDIVTMIKMGLQKNFNVCAFTDPILALEYFEANAPPALDIIKCHASYFVFVNNFINLY